MDIEDEDLDNEDLNLGASDEEVEEGNEVTGGEDEGSEDEGQEGGEPSAQAPEGQSVRKGPGRAERTILAAKQAAKEAKEEAARTRRELDEYKQAQLQRQPDPALEQARLAEMDPEARIVYLMQQSEQRNQKALRDMELTFKEQSDRASFAVRLSQNPGLRKYEGKVETVYAEHMAAARRNGTPVPDRNTILQWVVGGEVLRSSAKAVATSRKTGAANIARQTTKPANSKGDISRGGRQGKTAAERLADVTF